MADNSEITKQDTMKGTKGEWFVWIVAIFVIVALIASWAGGWWNGDSQDVSAPVATQPLTSEPSGTEPNP